MPGLVVSDHAEYWGYPRRFRSATPTQPTAYPTRVYLMRAHIAFTRRRPGGRSLYAGGCLPLCSRRAGLILHVMNTKSGAEWADSASSEMLKNFFSAVS